MSNIIFVICLVSAICWIVFNRSTDPGGSKKKAANIFRIIFIISCVILAMNSFSMAARFF